MNGASEATGTMLDLSSQLLPCKQTDATNKLLLAYTDSLVALEELRLAMSQNAPIPLNAETGASFTACKNCHSPMPSELRFCRNCGFRLGEGPEEYTETVRFPNGAGAAAGMPGSHPSAFGMAGAKMAPTAAGPIKRQRKRMSGMTWIFLALVIFFSSAGALTQLVRQTRRVPASFAAAASRSYFGVNQFKTADGGVTFDTIESPGSPADKAGLVGGDIITTFDGHPVSSNNEMMGRLMETPIGKTVDVVYLRDGETKTTRLTTISKGDLDQLGRAFAKRPEGRGRMGIDGQERVDIAGTKLHGVRLGTIEKSLPADMAGLKSGDVVIEFNTDGEKVPIRTAEELNARIQRAFPYTTIQVVIMRGSERLEIPVKIGPR
jgi:hypothetical protein